MTFWISACLLLAGASQAAAAGADVKVERIETKKEVVERRRETVQVKRRHAVVVANTLWDMAAFYYDDPWQWPRIYDANKDRIKNPHWIYPGQEFIIPGLDKMVTVVRERRTPKPATKPKPKPAPVVEEDPDLEAEPDLPSLSVEIPAGQTPSFGSMKRHLAPKGWQADGRVIRHQWREGMAAVGDQISLMLDRPAKVRKGSRYLVYRRSAPTEDEVALAMEGVFLQEVGEVRVVRRIGEKEFRGVIESAGGAVLENDLLEELE